MKRFYHAQIPWYSPLEIFPYVQKLSPHLFFSAVPSPSGLEENINQQFSFLPFNPQKKWTILKDQKQKWTTLQEIFREEKNQKRLKDISQEWYFPFCGGIAGVFSYDFSKPFFNIKSTKKSQHTPLAFYGIYEQFFAFDHLSKKLFLAGWFPQARDADAFFYHWKKVVVEKQEKCAQEQSIKTSEKFTPEISQDQYQKKFEICQQEIEKGNSFQINFSQKFTSSSTASAWDIFCRAVEKNPAPMMYFYEETETSIISCSPERLFSSNTNKTIFTQPIAGTRPRGKNTDEEKFYEHDLKTSDKEIAEHSMLVDLLRNDFGKISAFGSVQVREFGRVEKYATVIHLVSDIIGTITPKKTVFDVFEATFPGGTITGAPKQETMKILEKEEESSRGFYCGSAGYFSFCGASDWNILIRTLEKKGEHISGRAGGGIVYGANRSLEYEETLHKFSGMEKIFL